MLPVKPKKKLGQHFLSDENVSKKIVSCFLDDLHASNVLEIGPGTGVLTKHLIQNKFKRFYAIDLDQESISFLKAEFPNNEECFIFGDFLKTDVTTLFIDQYAIIGNFPYNISSQIVFKILEDRMKITFVTGMFQKEVAERICAQPGSKTYGILSVLTKAYFDTKILFSVHENCFNPPPKVKSAVISFKRNSSHKLDCNEELFFQLVKAGFNHRRKTLRNALKSFTFEANSTVTELLALRAEQLKVNDFVQLTQAVIS